MEDSDINILSTVKTRNTAMLLDTFSQMDFFTALKQDEIRLPDPNRLPHNEGPDKVRKILEPELNNDEVLMITGYASVSEIIKLLANRAACDSAKIRILFGNEPFMTSRRQFNSNPLENEIRDYWLNRGISILYITDVAQALAVLDSGHVEMRIANHRKGIHAKIYLTEHSATLGSSNYTSSGLAKQSEANIRFGIDELSRYQEVQQLGEYLWTQGEDYLIPFKELIQLLLKPVSWQESLARACSEVLEGEWAEKYIPVEELQYLSSPLWPHQVQGISQALWTLFNLGSVLIADAAGSGKTRMGAWIMRALYDKQFRSGDSSPERPVLIAPPAVLENWEDAFRESRVPIEPHSHGLLSQKDTRKKTNLIHDIESTSLLAVDEAHNFINSSARTQALKGHYADHAVLFTATPINREAGDLLSMVELLGADNFSTEAQTNLLKLRKVNSAHQTNQSKSIIQSEIQRFLVRRTRRDLNTLSDRFSEQYQMSNGRQARFPKHFAKSYELKHLDDDEQIMIQILGLCDQLIGIARFGKELYLPQKLKAQGFTEPKYLRMLILSTKALSRYLVLDCLRSSRAASYEHIHGTQAAISKFAEHLHEKIHKSTGDTLSTLKKLQGKPPVWLWKHLLKEDVPKWLWDPETHAHYCQQEIECYQQIGDLILRLSDQREQLKINKLIELTQRKGLVIAFDSHILSLELFHDALHQRKVSCQTFTGAQGASGKSRAIERLGYGKENKPFVALCSNALSEGMNMQGASVVMHLDSPTVIRIAEQRAGRVDRMNSEHDEVEIWWPNDMGSFKPREKDRLKARHKIVKDYIGANLELPEEEAEDMISTTELAQKSNIDREEIDIEEIFDAFKPIKNLIGTQGLISEDIYQACRLSSARVVSCVSVLKSEENWAFFAIGGPNRMAPRWVFMTELNKTILTSLDEVADALAQRLSLSPEDHALDKNAEKNMSRFLKEIGSKQHLLLSKRKKRVLVLAQTILKSWQKQAIKDNDYHRNDFLQQLEKLLNPDPLYGEGADLSEVANIWLNLFRPYQKDYFKNKKRWTLFKWDALKPKLLAEPIVTEQLEKAFSQVPYLAPLSDRVVAAIIGVGA